MGGGGSSSSGGGASRVPPAKGASGQGVPVPLKQSRSQRLLASFRIPEPPSPTAAAAGGPGSPGMQSPRQEEEEAEPLWLPPGPERGHFITDVLCVIADSEFRQIERLCRVTYEETGVPVFAATVPTVGIPADEIEDGRRVLPPQSLVSDEFGTVIVHNDVNDATEHYTNALFESWGLGSAHNSTGLLFLLWRQSPHWNFSVACGQGWCDKSGSVALMEQLVTNVIHGQVIPRLRESNFNASQAVLAGINALCGMARDLVMLQAERLSSESMQRHLFIPTPKSRNVQLMATEYRREDGWKSDPVGGVVAGVAQEGYLECNTAEAEERARRNPLLGGGRAVLCRCGECCAATNRNIPPMPKQGDWWRCIYDKADQITIQDRQFIERQSANFMNFRRAPVVVVTLPSLPGRNDREKPAKQVRRYAQSLFNAWHIGCATYNRGVLLLLVREDRSVCIVLGKGWERRMQDLADSTVPGVILASYDKTSNMSLSLVRGVKELDTQLIEKVGVPHRKANAPALNPYMGGSHR